MAVQMPTTVKSSVPDVLPVLPKSEAWGKDCVDVSPFDMDTLGKCGDLLLAMAKRFSGFPPMGQPPPAPAETHTIIECSPGTTYGTRVANIVKSIIRRPVHQLISQFALMVIDVA